MSGPRVTSGEDSKQDYATPADFIAAVEARFGAIQFDLAAHRMNKKHARYLAPLQLIETFDPTKQSAPNVIASLVQRGAILEDAERVVGIAVNGGEKTKISVRNVDPGALALDSFSVDWAELSRKYPAADGGAGLGWLNCEFSDCTAWSKRSEIQGHRGANVTLLTPAQVGSNWYRDFVAGRADSYPLNGRLCFDGKNPFPKDCMLSHYHPGATGAIRLWDWKRDVIVREWVDVSRVAASQAERLEGVVAQGRLFG